MLFQMKNQNRTPFVIINTCLLIESEIFKTHISLRIIAKLWLTSQKSNNTTMVYRNGCLFAPAYTYDDMSDNSDGPLNEMAPKTLTFFLSLTVHGIASA